MTVNLTVISVQITVSQLHAEQMENFLWICVSMKCASRHLLCVHNLKEMSQRVFQHLFITCFLFSWLLIQCVYIPAAPVWLLVYALTRLLLSRSERPAYF